MKRKLGMLVVLVFAFMLIGCQKAPEEYTYSDLDESQKQIIDGIYDKMDTWNVIVDSGEDWKVDKVNFVYEGDTLIFTTFHSYGHGSTGGISVVYEVDEDTGNISIHSYDLNEDLQQRSTFVQASVGATFYQYMEMSEQKDILAEQYMMCKNKYQK